MRDAEKEDNPYDTGGNDKMSTTIYPNPADKSYFHQQSSRRFNKFARALKSETGDRAHLCADGRIIIDANEFTPAQRYRNVQEAIDHFAHLIGTNF